MEVEEWASSSGGTSDSEVCVPDTNDEEHYFTSGDIPKLQFRKNISRAHWDDEMGMAEVVGKKGSMWTTIGIVRSSKIYCSIEETLFLAERGELSLLDADDRSVPLKDIYKKVAEGKSGCCWESFEVYRHLRSLGYIVGRHGIPWTVKSIKNKPPSVEGTLEIEVIIDQKFEDLNLVNELFNNIRIDEVRPVFDVYPPNSKFRKSSPGNPSFVLCMTRHYNNAFYARVGGVNKVELNKLELELLFLLDFGVTVSSRVFESYCLHLEKEMLWNGIGQKVERPITTNGVVGDETYILVEDAQSSSPPPPMAE